MRSKVYAEPAPKRIPMANPGATGIEEETSKRLEFYLSSYGVGICIALTRSWDPARPFPPLDSTSSKSVSW